MALSKIALDSKRDDHFVFVDRTKIKAIQVQYPISVSSLLQIKGEGEIGVVRLFLEGMTAPFQFTRATTEEVDELVKQLVEE